jgi:hypothetical protein
MTTLWQHYDYTMATLRQHDDNTMTALWQHYDNTTRKLWQNYDNTTTTLWQHYYHTMTTLRQHYVNNITTPLQHYTHTGHVWGDRATAASECGGVCVCVCVYVHVYVSNVTLLLYRCHTVGTLLSHFCSTPIGRAAVCPLPRLPRSATPTWHTSGSTQGRLCV